MTPNAFVSKARKPKATINPCLSQTERVNLGLVPPPAMSAEDMRELERLRAENAALKAAAAPKGLRFKVSEKGALSVYGLGRFPVTLYRGQWTKLLEQKGEIEAFIAANEATLKVKE